MKAFASGCRGHPSRCWLLLSPGWCWGWYRYGSGAESIVCPDPSVSSRFVDPPMNPSIPPNELMHPLYHCITQSLLDRLPHHQRFSVHTRTSPVFESILQCVSIGPASSQNAGLAMAEIKIAILVLASRLGAVRFLPGKRALSIGQWPAR